MARRVSRTNAIVRSEQLVDSTGGHSKIESMVCR